jgi:tetratricopeptide (TPR) repeat protein
MTRLALPLVLTALVAAGDARAESDIAVLGPAVEAKLSEVRVKAVRAGIVIANVGPASNRKLDSACANDPVCLGIIGTEMKARQVLAITANTKAVTFVLVDVQDKELLGKREVKLTDLQLAKELPLAIKKFLDEVPVERAKALFVQGNQHYSLGEFSPALEFYKRAYRFKPLPAFLFNIAQCHRKLGNHREAVTMYQSYLVGVPDAPNKALVESLIEESQHKLAEEQRIAEEKVKAAREAERLESERKRAEAERLAKEAEATAAAERAKAEQARLAAQRERDLEKTYDRHPARKWAIIGAGVGAAAVLAGGAFGLAARGAQSDFDDAGCGDPEQNRPEAVLAKCRADLDRGERNALLANSFMIGGGVAIAASAIVFLVDPGNIERPRERRAELRLSPTSVHVVLRW